MVQLTRGKNVAIETYNCEYKEFTATASQTDFTMANKANITTVAYSRAYVDNVEVTITSVSGATPAVVVLAAVTEGSLVQIIMPITKNGAYSVAQGIQWSVTSKNQEIPELGNAGVQEEVLEKNMRLNASWAQASNHDLMTKLLANAVADTYMVIAEKYKATSPVSYRIFKECKVDDFGQGVTAGGVSMESCSFTSRFPFVIA